MTSKRERATLAQKIQVLDYFHSSGSSQLKTVNKFRNEISISKSSLSEWLKRENDLRQSFAQDEFKLSKNSRRKVKFKYEKINRAMDMLVQSRLEKNEPITQPILRQHWSVYAHQYGVDDPKRLICFSHGWLNQFKKRHGLKRGSLLACGSLIQEPRTMGESEEANEGLLSDLSFDSVTNSKELGVETEKEPAYQLNRSMVIDTQLSEVAASPSPNTNDLAEDLRMVRDTGVSTSNTLEPNRASGTHLRPDSDSDETKLPSQTPPSLLDFRIRNRIRPLFLKHPLSNPSVEVSNVPDSDTEAIERLNKHHRLREKQPVQQQSDTTLDHLNTNASSPTGTADSIIGNDDTVDLTTTVLNTMDTASNHATQQQTESKGVQSANDNKHIENQVDVETFILTTADKFFRMNSQQYPETSKIYQSLKQAFICELVIARKNVNKTQQQL